MANIKKWANGINSKLRKTAFGKIFMSVICFLYLDELIYFLMDYIEPDYSREKVNVSKKFFEENREKVANILALFEDEFSKKTYKNAILYRTTGKKGIYCRFIEIVKNSIGLVIRNEKYYLLKTNMLLIVGHL